MTVIKKILGLCVVVPMLAILELLFGWIFFLAWLFEVDDFSDGKL